MHTRGKIKIDMAKVPLRRPSAASPSPVSSSSTSPSFDFTPQEIKKGPFLNGIKEVHNKDSHTQDLEAAVLQINKSYPRPKPKEVVDYLTTLILSMSDLELVFELLCKMSCLDRHSDSLVGDIFNHLLDKQFEFDSDEFSDEDFLWTLLEDTNEEVLRTLTFLQTPSKCELGMISLMCSMYRSLIISKERRNTVCRFLQEIAKALFPFSASANRSSILWNDCLLLLCFTDILKTIGKKLDVICPRNMESTYLEIRKQIVHSLINSNVRVWLVELCDQRASGWDKTLGSKLYKEHYKMLLPSIVSAFLEDDELTSPLPVYDGKSYDNDAASEQFHLSSSSGEANSPEIVPSNEKMFFNTTNTYQQSAALLTSEEITTEEDDVFVDSDVKACAAVKTPEKVTAEEDNVFVDSEVRLSAAVNTSEEVIPKESDVLSDSGVKSLSSAAENCTDKIEHLIPDRQLCSHKVNEQDENDWVETGEIEVESAKNYSISPSTGETRWSKSSELTRWSKADDAYSRPVTTGLTAHRLITGALGLDNSLSADIVAEEEKKIKVAADERREEIFRRRISEQYRREVKKFDNESFYWPSVSHGYMIQLSPPLTEFVVSKEARDLLMYEIGLVTKVRLQWMTGDQGEHLYIRGYRESAMEAVSYIAKINALLSDTEEEISKTAKDQTDTQLVLDIFGILHGKKDEKNESNGLYSREFLLNCALSPMSQERPSDLDLARNEDWVKYLVQPEGIHFDPHRFDPRLKYQQISN